MMVSGMTMKLTMKGKVSSRLIAALRFCALHAIR